MSNWHDMITGPNYMQGLSGTSNQTATTNQMQYQYQQNMLAQQGIQQAQMQMYQQQDNMYKEYSRMSSIEREELALEAEHPGLADLKRQYLEFKALCRE